jgi:hypothetical protein
VGGKGDAPPAPDYTPIAQSSLESAKVAQETSREQLQWAKEQYADQAPTTKKFVDQMVDDSKQQSAHAQTMFDQYQQTFQPMMKKFADTASGWNTPGRAEQQAGMAMADVSTQMNKQREASLQQLESFGVDPSQTRYAALDLGTRVQQAAATAATGTQSRQLTEQQALALQGQAINIGSGIPSQVTQTFAGAAGSGGTGMNAANAGMQTGSNIMGSPTSWGQLGNQSLGTSINAMNTGYSNAMQGAQFERQGSQDTMKGIGSLVGAAAMLAI